MLSSELMAFPFLDNLHAKCVVTLSCVSSSLRLVAGKLALLSTNKQLQKFHVHKETAKYRALHSTKRPLRLLALEKGTFQG